MRSLCPRIRFAAEQRHTTVGGCPCVNSQQSESHPQKRFVCFLDSWGFSHEYVGDHRRALTAQVARRLIIDTAVSPFCPGSGGRLRKRRRGCPFQLAWRPKHELAVPRWQPLYPFYKPDRRSHTGLLFNEGFAPAEAVGNRGALRPPESQVRFDPGVPLLQGLCQPAALFLQVDKAADGDVKIHRLFPSPSLGHSGKCRAAASSGSNLRGREPCTQPDFSEQLLPPDDLRFRDFRLRVGVEYLIGRYALSPPLPRLQIPSRVVTTGLRLPSLHST